MKRRTKEIDPRAKGRIILFSAILFIIILGVALPIILLPYDKTTPETANTVGNLMNGGKVVQGEGRIYYTDSTGIYSFPEDNVKKISKVDDSPADKLFYQSGKLYFSQNDSFYSCLFDGSMKTKIFNSFEDIQISGTWLYFLRDGELWKIRYTDNKYEKSLKIKTTRFYIIAQSVYFLGGDGLIYNAKTDGTGSEVFINKPSAQFMIDGQYMFLKKENSVRSAAMSDAEIGDDLPGTVFNVSGENYIYFKDGALFHKQLGGDSKKEDKKLRETQADEIYLCDEFVYFRKENGTFNRIRFDGTEFKELIAE